MATEKNKLPNHVGIIMDGNGRWAKKRLLPRSLGHKAGMENMIKLAEYARERGVEYLTLYVLSTENLQRPQAELDGLFDLMRKYFLSNVEKLYQKNSAVKVIGDISKLPQDVCELLENSQNNSPPDSEFTLIFAINYGGRTEILNAVNAAVDKGERLNEQDFEKLLYTSGLPDPDLIIRTGGEKRLSNFLMYQSAYAELYFTSVLFPDFSVKEFEKALEEYSKRNRRFGKITG